MARQLATKGVCLKIFVYPCTKAHNGYVAWETNAYNGYYWLLLLSNNGHNRGSAW